MTVLSDTAIRDRMRVGDLVPDGNPDWAEECSYSFRPGRAFIAGEMGSSIEFQSALAMDIVIEPGKMVWVRTSDRVKLPNNMVGFWWQTNTLSRKGLMLVNMSMVEPGYEGDLACLFVNFGNSKVIINADTVIAKIMFVLISGDVEHPFTRHSTSANYDATLRELAVNQPGSFLQIGDLAASLGRQRDDTLAELKLIGADLKAAAEREFTAAKADALANFNRDASTGTFKTFGWAAAALAILALASAGGGWLKDNVLNDPGEVARTEAEKVVRERILLSATPASANEVALRKQLDLLTQRLSKLEEGEGKP